MPGKANAKLKAFKLVEILNEMTDEDHPMNSNEICAELAERGIEAERKSIYSDIDVLIEAGYDIIKTVTPKRGAYMGERNFQIAEVRLLIDAVESAKFITESKTADLIEKIQNSLSVHQKQSLSKQVYINNRNKTDNEQIYYIIDALYCAVQNGKKVRVTYRRRKIEVCGNNSYEERVITVSPYALIWSDDHYYLICNNNKYDNLMHLRIDRIKKVTALEDDARPFSEVSEYTSNFDAADYTAKHFNMFSGEKNNVVIRCNKNLSEVVLDKFGSNVMITERTDDTFTISADVAVSEGLVAWLLQYGSEMIVLEPCDLRESVLKKAREAVEAYELST